MRPSTNNRPRPRRRGFPYRQALAAIRPELARQLVEPVEATLFDREAGGGAVRHLGHDRKHGQRQLHLWDWRPAGGDGVTIGFEIRPIDEPPRFPKLEAGFFIAPRAQARRVLVMCARDTRHLFDVQGAHQGARDAV